MKNKITITILFATSLIAGAENLELISLEHLTGLSVSPDNCFVDANRDGKWDGTTSGLTMAEVRANTNSPAFAAWLAERNADATEDAALGQEMTVALVHAIATEWNITFNGSKKQVRQLSRRLIVESKAARQTLDDSNATIEDRLDAIAKLRRLDVISGYANQLGIGAK